MTTFDFHSRWKNIVKLPLILVEDELNQQYFLQKILLVLETHTLSYRYWNEN